MAKDIQSFMDELGELYDGGPKSVWEKTHDTSLKWDVRVDALNKILQDSDVGPMIQEFTNEMTDYCVKATIASYGVEPRQDEHKVFMEATDEFLAKESTCKKWAAIKAMAEKKGFMDKEE